MMMEALMQLLLTTVSALGCDSPENCVNLTCHLEQATPICTHGCVAGYAGNLCKEYCFHKCVACERNDPERCTNCDKGFFGNRCESQCPNCLNSSCHINGSCVEGCKSSWGSTCTKTCPDDCKEECDQYSGVCITDTTVTFRTPSQVEQASTSTQKTSSDCDHCTTNRPSQRTADSITSQGLDLTVILSVTVTLMVLAIFAGTILCIFRNGCPLRQMNKQDNEEVPLEEFQNVYERLNDDSLTASAGTNASYDTLQIGDSATASDEQTTTGCLPPKNKKSETDCKFGTERPKTPVRTSDFLPISSNREGSERDMYKESQANLCLDTEHQFIPKTSSIKQVSDSFKPENGGHNKDVFDPTNKYAVVRSSQSSLTKLASSDGEKEINNLNISPKTPRRLTMTTVVNQSLEKASSAEYDDQDKSSTKNQPDTSNYPHTTWEARQTLNKHTLENNDYDKETIGIKDAPDMFKSPHTKRTSDTRKNRELEKVHQRNALNDSEHRNVTSDVNGIPVHVTTGIGRIETANAEKSVYTSEEFCSNRTSEIEEMSDQHTTENENKENQCSSTKSQTHPSIILAYTGVPSEIKQTSVELAACTTDGENEVNPEKNSPSFETISQIK